jgi:hypothetical protein
MKLGLDFSWMSRSHENMIDAGPTGCQDITPQQGKTQEHGFG